MKDVDPSGQARVRRLRFWVGALCLGPALGVLALSSDSLERRLGMTLFALVAFGAFGWARLRSQQVLEKFRRPNWLAVAYFRSGLPLDLFMVAQLVSARGASTEHWMEGPVLMWVGPVWYSAHALLFFAFLLVGAGRGLSRILRRRPRAQKAFSPSRRQFLEGSAVAAFGFPFVISLSGVGTSYDFQVEEREIFLPHWPRALDGLRVAHLSDIHVGGPMNAARLLRIAELTNRARPDLVLHTGDFLTHRDGNFDAPLYPALAAIRAPMGQWACRGNHDFDDPRGFPRKLRAAGVEPLLDRQEILRVEGQELRIGGLDYISPRYDRSREYPARVRALGAHDGEPRLLLLHDPSQWVHIPAGQGNLILSGHTHGGHIGIPWGDRPLWTVVGAMGYPDQGIFQRDDDTVLYVTRCVGFYGYPLRLGIPPEIALLNLRSA